MVVVFGVPPPLVTLLLVLPLLCAPAGTFNGQGRCTSVPQLPEGQSLSSTRSCVVSYPTRTSEGLLWVWPDASPAALIESADEAAWPGLAPELDEFGDRAFSRAIGNHRWYARWVIGGELPIVMTREC